MENIDERSAENAFKEQKASWLELFFDLAYVAAIAQLTYWLINSDGTMLEYAQFILLFVMVFMSWLMTAVYRNIQGGREDRFERVATIVQMFFVLVMSVFLQEAFNGGAIGFILGYVGTRVIVTFLISRHWRLQPEERPNSMHMIQGFRIAHVLWILTLFIPQPFQALSWVLLLAFEFALPHTSSRKIQNKTRIVNRFHLPERLGLFTILVMGESLIVVAVVNNLADTAFSISSGVIAGSSFLIMAGLWWMYFDHVETYAMGKKFNLFAYMYVHIPILLGIMFIAVGTKVGMLDKGYGVDPLWLTTAGVALAIVGFNALKVSTGQRVARIFAPSAVFIFFIAIGAFINAVNFVFALPVLMAIFFGYMYFEHKECHTELHALRAARELSQT